MGTSIVVDSQTFATEVIQKSFERPVLVDFFATWCGPCQLLKPILEKLAKEYEFVLAKIDIDQNPELASTYGIEGVPDVRIVTQGEVQQGFVGVLPEAQLRELLVNRLQLTSALEAGLASIQVAKAAGDLDQVKRLFGQLIEQYPDDRQLLLEAAQFLISQDRFESAEKLLVHVQPDEKDYFAKAQALQGLIQLKREFDTPVVENDLDELFLKAAQLTLKQDYEGALQTFLEIVGRDRKYRNDGARKGMITIFDVLGDAHPLTKTYRKKLMSTLY